MSVALRLAEALERGDGLPDDPCLIALVAAILAPVYGRSVTVYRAFDGRNDFGSQPLTGRHRRVDA